MPVFDVVSPASRRVRLFVSGKGWQLPTLTADIFTGENHWRIRLGQNAARLMPALCANDASARTKTVGMAESLAKAARCNRTNAVHPDHACPAPATVGSVKDH